MDAGPVLVCVHMHSVEMQIVFSRNESDRENFMPAKISRPTVINICTL